MRAESQTIAFPDPEEPQEFQYLELVPTSPLIVDTGIR